MKTMLFLVYTLVILKDRQIKSAREQEGKIVASIPLRTWMIWIYDMIW